MCIRDRGETDASTFKERNIQVEKLQDMMVLHNRKLPDNAITFPQLFEEWKSLSAAQTSDYKRRLTAALATEWPEQVTSDSDGERIVLGRPGVGDRIPAIWIKGCLLYTSRCV